ncbi:MAG: 50S ribosomal protein L30 [Dehalococcoidia bacterium]|nr:50S ribosomal protein L30 [Dehalococcoidia bacterium]
MAETKFAVTWKRSAISQPRSQREVIRSLGLRRLNHTVVLQDTPAIRGMIHKVRHLLSVEAVNEPAEADKEPAKKR